MVEPAMAARANRALFIMDLGVPRNVDAQVGSLYNVYLYNIDDLTEIVDQNKKAREEEIPRAEALIEEHVGKFEAWQASVQAASVLNQLRAKLHHEREQFLQKRLAEMQALSAEDRQRVAKLTEELLEHVLLDPAERLRARGLRRRFQDLEALRDLFGLEKP
jgi:glutamyl-tRNA reductase